MRSAEIFFSVCLKGHRSDPLQALPYEAFVVFRRLLSKRESVRELFQRVWTLRQEQGGNPVRGPVWLLRRVVSMMGWEWNEPFVFDKPEQGELALLDQPKNWWNHKYARRCESNSGEMSHTLRLVNNPGRI